MSKIIAFTGKMGVGKSEAINALKLHAASLNAQVALVKFAQPLYDMQEYIYGRIESVHVRKPDFTKDRTLLQWLGTEWGRNTISKSIWVDLWKAEVARLSKVPNIIIVCDDCRFDNEAEVLRSVEGSIIKIVSDKTNERINLQNTAHASEAGVSDAYVDMVIENNYSLEEYKNQLTHAFRLLGL